MRTWLQVSTLRSDDEPHAMGVHKLLDIVEEVERGPARAVELEHEEGIEPPAAGGLKNSQRKPGRSFLAPEPVSSTSRTTRYPSRLAATRSSARASVGSWSRVETRW